MRGLRISPHLRRFARSRLRADRGSHGRRAMLRLRAKELRTACECALAAVAQTDNSKCAVNATIPSLKKLEAELREFSARGP